MITVINVRGMRDPVERRKVCYVGRSCDGWTGHPLGNPHKGHYALALFSQFLEEHPRREELLAELWQECEHGARPLGCWCVPRPWAVTLDDSQIHVCHAQMIAVALFVRFAPKHLVSPDVPDGWRCPRFDPPADGTLADLITRDGRVHPALTRRSGQWLIRNFSPWQGREVGWRPSVGEGG